MKKRRARENLFTVDFLDTQQLTQDPLGDLFRKTKAIYKDDHIFDTDEEIRLKTATGRDIVKKLQAYNLSDTSEDIKGIAFERFLGRTFRGEIGQFFTPRTIVEFMIRMVEPREGDVICDPASGSGGFLIRFFEIVRQQILSDADRQYQTFKAEIEQDKKIPKDRKAALLSEKFDTIQAALDHEKDGSRLWTLANRRIYGTDANDRMARTSKMNMIMHGDGHGGVHHHDGFLNVNGIFENRFDIVLTNPPFGANVEPTDVVHESDAAVNSEAEKRYTEEFHDLYREAMARVTAAKGKPIASLFELPKGNGTEKEQAKRVKTGKIKTEILFIERCLSLLKPGGRLGIVLPEGIFNNPSLAYVREFCENRAFIRAVVSLPQEAFFSSGASVKASLLFMQKFTEPEQIDFDVKQAAASAEVKAKYAAAIAAETTRIETAISAAKEARDAEGKKALQKELSDYQKRMAEIITRETRALLKERFPYPIFLYDAQKVGITATGEQDQNELVPNDNQPPDIAKTCLELYQEFCRDPKPFLLTEAKV
jgi:type I restriction enzyme M protein